MQDTDDNLHNARLYIEHAVLHNLTCLGLYNLMQMKNLFCHYSKPSWFRDFTKEVKVSVK